MANNNSSAEESVITKSASRAQASSSVAQTTTTAPVGVDSLPTQTSVQTSTDNEGVSVNFRAFNRSDYIQEEVMVLIDQTTVPIHTFRNIDLPHVQDLVKSMSDFGFSYNSGMIVITVTKSSNPSANISSLSFKNLLKDNVLLPSLHASVLDGLHRRNAVLRLKNEVESDASRTWPSEHLRMILVLRRDGVDMSQTELLTWSSHENTKTTTVRESHKTFSEKMHTAMAYYNSFLQDYNIPEGDIPRVVDVAESMRKANVCRGVSSESAKRIVRVCRYFLKHEGLYQHLVNIEKRDYKRSLGVSHLDDSIYHELDKGGVILFMDSAAAYIRNDPQPKAGKKKGESRGIFPCRPFYESARSMYDLCHQLHDQYCTRDQQTFEQFLALEVSLSPSKTSTIRDLFISQMRLFSYSARSEKDNNANNKRRESTLTRKITSHFRSLNAPTTTTPDTPSLPQPAAASSTRTPSKRERKQVSRFAEEQQESQPPRKKRATAVSASATSTPSNKIQNHRKARASGVARTKKVGAFVKNTAAEEEGQAEQPVTEVVEQYGRFDDVQSEKLPFGIHSLPTYEGSLEPHWQKFASLPPHVLVDALRHADLDLHVTPWLRAIYINEKHRANLFVDMDYLLFLHRMAWFMACQRHLEQINNRVTDEVVYYDVWEESELYYESGLGSSYFAERRVEVLSKGYTVLTSFADFSLVPKKAIWAMEKRKEMFSESRFQSPRMGDTEQLFGEVLKTFPGEQELKNPQSEGRKLWNPIVNTGLEETDESDRNRGKARYSSTRHLLTDVLEKSEDTVWIWKSRASLDVWIGQVCRLLHLTSSEQGRMWLPTTGGRFLMTGEGCRRQVPHHDFVVDRSKKSEEERKKDNPGFFIIVSGDDPFPLWVCDHSHNYVYYTEMERERLCQCFKMKKIIVPPRSIFIGHGYCTHAGAGNMDKLVEKTTIRYHLYLHPEAKRVPDAIAFSFPESFTFVENAEEEDDGGDGNEEHTESEQLPLISENSDTDDDDDMGSQMEVALDEEEEE